MGGRKRRKGRENLLEKEEKKEEGDVNIEIANRVKNKKEASFISRLGEGKQGKENKGSKSNRRKKNSKEDEEEKE